MGSGVKVGRISPGIMITDFLRKPLGGGDKEIQLDEHVKKVYNILGDYPDRIAAFVVERILGREQKNGEQIIWLTKWRAAFRFACAVFRKRKIVK